MLNGYTAVPILEEVGSLFVQQLPLAGQIKVICIEICPATGSCWTKPYLKWELLMAILLFINVL